MSHGFNSKSLKYPVSHLVKLLMFVNERATTDACTSCGLTVHNGDVIFQKSSFKETEQVCTDSYYTHILCKFICFCTYHMTLFYSILYIFCIVY